jgi:type II secretory ATPase GspE/PulE/Tfp pilus assembly ATPase PilB-like protein
VPLPTRRHQRRRRVVDSIVTQALRRASDVHLEPQDDEIRVRYRVDRCTMHVAGTTWALR